jgi:hypothetical protein
MHIQEALSDCGWKEAAEIAQQDTSEAFTFITGKMELPLLTLKMDIYHSGKEDKEDDHKLVNERLLEVAVPPPSEENGNSVTLEECLENYFNNRIEVKRHLQRRHTLQGRSTDYEKSQAIHVETVEIDPASGPASPLPSTPTSVVASPLSAHRPVSRARRADSIFSERHVIHGKPIEKQISLETASLSGHSRPRGLSIRKEVMMPAWQFFSLIRTLRSDRCCEMMLTWI